MAREDGDNVSGIFCTFLKPNLAFKNIIAIMIVIENLIRINQTLILTFHSNLN